jgi:hypothetical protein
MSGIHDGDVGSGVEGRRPLGLSLSKPDRESRADRSPFATTPVLW